MLQVMQIQVGVELLGRVKVLVGSYVGATDKVSEGGVGVVVCVVVRRVGWEVH
jgi:hypothetical protein